MVELVAPAIAALLSGGIVAALVALYKARKTAPAERDSLIVSGAETAVTSLEKSLAAETRRADRAEERVDELERALANKDARIASLEARLDTLQSLLNEAREELHAIRSPKR